MSHFKAAFKVFALLRSKSLDTRRRVETVYGGREGASDGYGRFVVAPFPFLITYLVSNDIRWWEDVFTLSYDSNVNESRFELVD